MDPRRLDLNLLMILDALLQDPNLTNTARRLKVTQPAISLCLKRLRLFFQDELFVRAVNGMRPTPLAEQLREPVRRAIDLIEIDIIKSRPFEPDSSRHVFRLCLSDVGECVFLPGLLERLHQQAPNVSFSCLSLPPGRLAASMDSGEVDLAIGYFPDIATANFFRQSLFQHPVVCLVRARHPNIRESLSVEQFLGAEHAIVTHEGRGQDLFERTMQELGLERQIKVRLAHLLSVPHIIMASNLIAVVPRAVAATGVLVPELRALPLPVPIAPLEIKQYWHRRAHRDPAVTWLRKVVAGLYLGKDPSADCEPGPRARRPR